MDILLYLFLLLVAELFVYSFCVGIDYYLKYKNHKIKKNSFFFCKSRFDEGNTISCVAYWIQVFNYIYLLSYVSIAIIDSFIYSHYLLFNTCIYSLCIYGGLALIGLIVVTILSPKK